MQRKTDWRLVAAGVLGIVVVLVAGYCSVLLWRENILARKIADLRAAGDPVSLPDLAPAPIPADEDAAVLLSGARVDIKKLALAGAMSANLERYSSSD